jgi:hypothetical protein
MAASHVVVDGSNIATEGRSSPSLQQLDDAIREYQTEFPDAEVIVVVDATFGHRIEPSERAMFDEAVAHGELVTPPAGAIGRGDAFVLRVAERVGAQVLSNDSFQEFHADHPWLFDEGRLMGGKPVPGVGWIFTPRLPVRGPRSRAVTSTGTRRRGTDATAGAEESDGKASRRSPRARGTSKTATDAIALATAEAKSGAANATKSAKSTKSTKSAKATSEPATAARTAKAVTTSRAAKTTTSTKATKGSGKAAKAAKATKATKAAKVSEATKATKAAKVRGSEKAKAPATTATTRRQAAQGATGTKASAGTKVTKATKATKEPVIKTVRTAKALKKLTPVAPAAAKAVPPEKGVTSGRGPKAAKRSDAAPRAAAPVAGPAGTPVKTSSSRRGRRGRATAAAAVRAAIEAATNEALGASDATSASRPPRARRDPSPAPVTSAPATVNDPLTFLTFVSEHPLGSTVVGTVSSFVSHGAMVDVDGMSCYLPLTGLGDPPPRRAREVVERGETRAFVLVALDPPRRGAELALPDLAKPVASPPADPTPSPPADPTPSPSRRSRRVGRPSS